VEHPAFQNFIQVSQSASLLPDFPSAKTIQRRLQSLSKDRQQHLLRTLPPDAKISIALDCWTSPFQQAFMAVTSYFIDIDWNYQEILLGFEPLHGTHSGINLSAVLLGLLEQYKITNQVLAVTTDNASNNKTLLANLQESMPDNTPVIRVPCIAHVIQLSLKQLLGHMKASLENETTKMQWSEKMSQSAYIKAKQQDHEIVGTLNKVWFIYLKSVPCLLTIIFS
jgi:hypothetical protein